MLEGMANEPSESNAESKAQRRRVLTWLGAGGLLMTGTSGASAQNARPAPACVVRPEQTEGPYFVDTGLNRSDIRTDPTSGVAQEGVLLRLAFNVSRVKQGKCEALAGAHVELWHCNAHGVYSGVSDRDSAARGQKFLRGYQGTDAAGVARFVTVYPGWYPGRAVHLHFIIRAADSSTRTARLEQFTSQLYFDDALSERIFASAPYASHSGRRLRNNEDGLYRDGGQRLLVAPTMDDKGLAAVFNIGLQA